jgi:hypothetical protein
LFKGPGVTREEFQGIGQAATLDDQLAQFGGGLKGATEALNQFIKSLLTPFAKEVSDRGLGDQLAISPGDDPQRGLIKARALADIARINVDVARAGEDGGGNSAAWADVRKAWGDARKAAQEAWGGTPSSDVLGAAGAIGASPRSRQPDLSGAAERAASSEAQARALEQGLTSGITTGANAALNATDVSEVASAIVQELFPRFYDKLVRALEDEAARL